MNVAHIVMQQTLTQTHSIVLVTLNIGHDSHLLLQDNQNDKLLQITPKTTIKQACQLP